MQTGADYPSLIKSLKEEIATLKTQIGQELNSSASSAFTRRESPPTPPAVMQLKLETESLRAVVQTLRLRIQGFRDLAVSEGRKFSPSGSLSLLVTRLQAKISDYSRKVALLKGGEGGFTARLESSRKTANEQFTNVQKRIGALERRNEAIRERMKTVESEKQRLQDSYQSTVLRTKGDQNSHEKADYLEREIEAKERKITLMRLYISGQLERNRYPSPTKSTDMQKQLAHTREDIKYLQSKIVDMQNSTRKPLGLQAYADRLKATEQKIEEEIQLTSREIRTKDKELLEYELKVEQLKSDLEKARGSFISHRIRESSPIHTNSPSPINRSVALSKPAALPVDLEAEPQPDPQRSPGQVKRCGSLSALRRAAKSPVKSVGLASRIVAMNRGQFETNKQ